MGEQKYSTWLNCKYWKDGSWKQLYVRGVKERGGVEKINVQVGPLSFSWALLGSWKFSKNTCMCTFWFLLYDLKKRVEYVISVFLTFAVSQIRCEHCSPRISPAGWWVCFPHNWPRFDSCGRMQEGIFLCESTCPGVDDLPLTVRRRNELIKVRVS